MRRAHRVLPAVLLVGVGCAAAPEHDWPARFRRNETVMAPVEPMPYTPPQRRDWNVEQPRQMAFLSVTPGDFSYTTKGTASDVSARADMRLYRLLMESYGGAELSWLSTDADLNGNTKAEAFDWFAYAGYSNYPNKRLRFMPRLGMFFNRYNLKNARAADVEPWSWGFRSEVEGEFAVVQTDKVAVTLFANGRVGWGWGDAKVSGIEESTDYFGYGWEGGLRLNASHFYFALSWVDREDEYRGSFRFYEATYGSQGATFAFGLRW